jgi:phosphogluconate dehydratase
VHADIPCVSGGDLRQQAMEPFLDGTALRWRDPPAATLDNAVVRPAADPFDVEGGLRRVQGNLGRGIVKISAVAPEFRRIEAPARVFESQDDLLEAFKAGTLQGDLVAVIRGQGPRANGMPELHKLTPTLAAMQDRGQRVALLTDGRMSGASGKVLSAIHVTPESADGGPISRVRDGDRIRIDADAGTIDIDMPDGAWQSREPHRADLAANRTGMGRELFAMMRAQVGTAESGGSALWADEEGVR